MMPRRRAAATSGNSRPWSSRMPFGAGAYIWVTTSPRLSRGRMARIGETVWAVRIMTRRVEGAGHVFRQPRLDADHDVAIAGDRALRQGHVGGVDVVQLAGRGDAGARNV